MHNYNSILCHKVVTNIGFVCTEGRYLKTAISYTSVSLLFSTGIAESSQGIKGMPATDKEKNVLTNQLTSLISV